MNRSLLELTVLLGLAGLLSLPPAARAASAKAHEPVDRTAHVRDGKTQVVDIAEIAAGHVWADLTELPTFAAFSSAAYDERRDGETAKSLDEYCAPEGLRKLFRPTGWLPMEYLPLFPATPPSHFRVGGIGYRVWMHQETGKNRAVIAFRGTDARQIGDWISNLRWITRYIPGIWDQYGQTRALIPDLVAAIQKRLGQDVEIVATGHSLGGGLAQQAAYCSYPIRKVFAFDPSTVTGYYSVPKAIRQDAKKKLDIYRAYEHGEILSYLRAFTKRFYPLSHENPRIVEVRYNLLQGNIVSQHSIRDFACHLHVIAKEVAVPDTATGAAAAAAPVNPAPAQGADGR